MNAVAPPHWLDPEPERLTAWFAARGEPAWRVRQLWEAYHRYHAEPEPRVTSWPRRLVAEFFAEHRWRWAADAVVERDPTDGTRKWVFRLVDGLEVESVMIPDGSRRTLCLSSQVGCALGCRFCYTGAMGFRRHLGVGELLGQWLAVDAALRAEGDRGLTHLVWMGMGEPLHNHRALRRALAWFTGTPGLGLAPGRITVSTVGLPGEALPWLLRATRVNVAISLHAADPGLRAELVPAERGLGAEALRRLLWRERHRFGRRKLTLEVTLMAGVNDTPAAARALARWVRGLPARVNLIPYNPHPGAPFRRPEPERVLRFQRILRAAGVPAWIRRTRGARISAACGTLHRRTERKTA